MANEPDDLILIHLRRIELKVDGLSDRMTSLERVVGRMAQDVADFRMDLLRENSRIDRVERRLDLREVDTH